MQAILVCVNFNNDLDFNELTEEGVLLSNSYGYEIKQIVTLNRKRIDAKYFIGNGKAEEIKDLCESHGITTIIVNHNISPIHERNLEEYTKCAVIDRTQLILDIFGKYANTSESKLQIELASLTHQISRLVKRWSHLERQKGGIGLRGGPGETQLELDKRMIANKIKTLKERLKDVVTRRDTQRRSRSKQEIPSISIVGYTNAGKSTLFNSLTRANVYAENRLFATLKTTSRNLKIQNDEANTEIILSDTVGFIRELPHTLVAAFRATLEEAKYADILLHVIDVNHPLKTRQIADVDKVLDEIDAKHLPQLLVYNKIDLKDELTPRIEYSSFNEPVAVYISAINKTGLDLLQKAILEKISYLKKHQQHSSLTLPQESAYEPWKE